METMNVRLSLFAAVTLMMSGCMATPSGGNSRRGQQAPAEVVDSDKKEKEKKDFVILDDEKKD